MYNQPEIALDQYDLEIRKMSKGRGAYICDTDRGVKALVPFKGSETRAETIRFVLMYMLENGMEVEQIDLTKDGKVISEDDMPIKYLLKNYQKGVECNPNDMEDIYEAAALLGRIHCITKECDIEPPDFMNNCKNKVLEDTKRHNKELVKIRNFVKNRKQKNEFEILFWNRFKLFFDHALLSTECQDSVIAYPPNIWCHGDYNYHNVIRTKEGLVPVNFESMEWNMGITDLTNFMRKILEKNSWDIRVGENIIEAYERENVLKEDEKRLLGYMLLYPEKFWKVANHYYNRHKAWISGRDIEKLEKVIEQEDAKISFLQKIFSFVI